jgi:hypothetical protein
LNTRFNNGLGIMSVGKKLAEYRKANTPADSILMSSEEWTVGLVQERSVHLAELMWDVVDAAFK